MTKNTDQNNKLQNNKQVPYKSTRVYERWGEKKTAEGMRIRDKG